MYFEREIPHAGQRTCARACLPASAAVRCRLRRTVAEVEDAISHRPGDWRPAAELRSWDSPDQSEPGCGLLRDLTAAVVQRGMADFVARIFLQSGQHSFSGLWSGYFHRARRDRGRPLVHFWFRLARGLGARRCGRSD